MIVLLLDGAPLLGVKSGTCDLCAINTAQTRQWSIFYHGKSNNDSAPELEMPKALRKIKIAKVQNTRKTNCLKEWSLFGTKLPLNLVECFSADKTGES